MGRATLARWVGLAAVALAAAACGQAPAEPGPGGGGGGGGATTAPGLALRSLGAGTGSGVQGEAFQVIRDEAAWRAFWAGHDAAEPVPAVDFATEMVAAVVLQRNTGGWRVRLVDAREDGGRVVVGYAVTGPGPDDVVIQVLTQPWAFAALPRREGPVAFEAR